MKRTLLALMIAALFGPGCTSGRKAQMLSDDALLDTIERTTSLYFTDFINPNNGLARERANWDYYGDIVTTGGTGFGMMAIVAAAERQYIPREQAVAQLDNITRFLDRVERFHGAWAHWYASETEQVYPFSPYDDGGDLVETAFLTEGLLVVRQWLQNSEVEAEREVAQRADKLWKEIEWDWYTQGTDSLYWHWSKNHGWKMNHRIKGFDECFITYVLAAASPTHPIERKVYEACYKNSPYYYNGKAYYGIKLSLGMEYGGPLFFTHYSWLGLNPHGLTDGEVNYFERNRAHALIHYNYALENPKGHAEYGANLWGFTSSDDPLVGYCSHHPGTPDENGTVSPTAAVASIVYTPEQSMAVIRHLYEDLGEQVFGRYGFYDAYNPSLAPEKQVVPHYLAIDQGPIVVMIENYRSGLIWNLFMQAPEVQTGLERLGFYYEQ
jgi:hypothetical protein